MYAQSETFESFLTNYGDNIELSEFDRDLIRCYYGERIPVFRTTQVVVTLVEIGVLLLSFLIYKMLGSKRLADYNIVPENMRITATNRWQTYKEPILIRLANSVRNSFRGKRGKRVRKDSSKWDEKGNYIGDDDQSDENDTMLKQEEEDHIEIPKNYGLMAELKLKTTENKPTPAINENSNESSEEHCSTLDKKKAKSMVDQSTKVNKPKKKPQPKRNRTNIL